MNVQIIKKNREANALLDFFRIKNGIKPDIHYSTMKYFARITQFISWPFIFLYFNLFFKLRISGRENIDKAGSPFIIISNHIAFYDSFVFRLIFSPFTKKLPLRFMAVNSFKYWYLNLLSRLFITDIIYIIFGVFIVVKGRGIDKNLEEAVRIIKNGSSVVVYPEGGINHNGNIDDFKLGASVLAKKTNVPVIPISMKITGLSFRKSYIINIGEPIIIEKNQIPDEITSIFHDTIVNLHNKD